MNFPSLKLFIGENLNNMKSWESQTIGELKGQSHFRKMARLIQLLLFVVTGFLSWEMPFKSWLHLLSGFVKQSLFLAHEYIAHRLHMVSWQSHSTYCHDLKCNTIVVCLKKTNSVNMAIESTLNMKRLVSDDIELV